MQKPGFWDDKFKSQEIVNKVSALKIDVEKYMKAFNVIQEINDAMLLLQEEDDSDLLEYALEQLTDLEKLREETKAELLFNGKYDSLSAIVDINAGAGGTEAQDWVEILYRMYQRFCNLHDYKIKTLSYHTGDMAGIKSVSFEVEGYRAFGMLKSEIGVHRLIRISPFDTAKKRHTSFASIHVSPVVDESVDIVILKEDLKIETFRSGGAGGQSVNTTDSAVRITHLPTGIVCSCQNERSQISNRETAMKMLKSKLASLEQQKYREEMAKLAGIKTDIAWGAQIRSYVFTPYTMVKDHRTNFETSNVSEVLDGKIDHFIYKFLELEVKYTKR